MKTYYGNYLGMVIDNNDPDFRGRVQVFIPHIMPTLYEGWNKDGKNITINCVGDNMPQGLTSDIVERLKKILPWAEAASPIVGQSAPGGVMAAIAGAISAVGGAAAGAISAVGGAVAGAVTEATGGAAKGANLDLSPSAIPAGSLPPGNHCNIPQSGAQIQGLTTPFIQRLNGFYKEAASLGYTCNLVSAYRAHEKQLDLWNKDLASHGGKPSGGVARPYNSAHEYGIAVDMKVSGNGVVIQTIKSAADRSENKDTPAFRALLAKYGLHQPLHPDNGGSVAEKWHIEPSETKNVTRGQQGFQALENKFRQQAPSTAEVTSSSQFPAQPNPLTSKSPLGTDVDQPTSPKTNLVPVAPAVQSDTQSASVSAAAPVVPSASITSTAPTVTTSSGITAPAGTTVTTGPTTGATTTASTGQSQLAKDRTARFQIELNNSQVVDRVEYLFFHQESTTKDPACGSVIFETAVNRAMFSNNTLYKTLFSSYYTKKGMGKTVPATKLAREIIDRVIYKGQNHTDLATDNASNEPGNPVTKKRIDNGCPGSFFDLNTGKQITDPAQIIRLQTANEGSKEYLYRATGGGGYRTNAGIEATKYATKYNITPTNPSSFKSGTPLPPELAGARNSSLTNNEVGASESPATVGNTDPHGPTVVKNTNDSPKGMFAFPGLGAMVWIFFREGNPQFPVYFAASYSSEEWKAAYHGASLNPEGTNNGSVGTQISNSMKLNPNAGGGLEFTHVKDSSDPSGANDKAVAMMYGDDGSNMMFAKGYHQLYTRHDRRDQIDGHAYNIIGGAEEKWVEDDSSVNVRGNVTIKVGKIDAESIDAMKELSDFSNQLNQTLMTNTATQQ